METVDIQETKLQRLVKQLAEFIALFETAADKIENHEVLTGKKLATIEAQFNRQVETINQNLGDYKDLLSETGIARWRIAAEQALKEGKDHISQLQQASQVLLNEIESGVERFESARSAAVLQLNEATKLIGLNEFREATQQYRDSLQKQTSHIIEGLKKATSWFFWQRILAVIAVAVLASLTTSYMVFQQMPWESSKAVAAQRQAGKVLLTAWPKLSKTDQDYIKSLAHGSLHLA